MEWHKSHLGEALKLRGSPVGKPRDNVAATSRHHDPGKKLWNPTNPRDTANLRRLEQKQTLFSFSNREKGRVSLEGNRPQTGYCQRGSTRACCRFKFKLLGWRAHGVKTAPPHPTLCSLAPGLPELTQLQGSTGLNELRK